MRFPSFHQIQLSKQSRSIAPPGIWTNADQDPGPAEKRTWTGEIFVLYWQIQNSECFN